MESILNLILSTENVRTLAIIVSVFCSVVWLKASMTSMHRRIDGVEVSIKELKGSFKALTYVLEKNGSLSKAGKEYVDSRLVL